MMVYFASGSVQIIQEPVAEAVTLEEPVWLPELEQPTSPTTQCRCQRQLLVLVLLLSCYQRC